MEGVTCRNADFSEALQSLRTIMLDRAKSDNQITRDPIYLVRESRRIYGMDLDFSDKSVWLDEEGNEVDPNTPGSLETGSIDIKETVQAFLSERAAQSYITRNWHRHRGDLSIYVDSLYRNDEMKKLCEALEVLTRDE
jgi:hypothetical protein